MGRLCQNRKSVTMDSNLPLKSAVEGFAKLTYPCSEGDLERPWVWGSYDEEGIRFAFFRIYEELRQLASELEAARLAAKKPISKAQRALAQYHSAFRDLEVILLGYDDGQLNQPPAEGQWSLRQILLHSIEADMGFFFVIRRALDGARNIGKPVVPLSDEGWQAFWAGDRFDALRESGSVSKLLRYYAKHHNWVLNEFASIDNTELALPSEYWEDEPMNVQFRLHRFDAHLRQHTIQAEKTLVAIGLGPGEPRRLLRMVYNALAEVEGMQIGAPEVGIESSQALAEEITTLTREIEELLA